MFFDITVQISPSKGWTSKQKKKKLNISRCLNISEQRSKYSVWFIYSSIVLGKLLYSVPHIAVYNYYTFQVVWAETTYQGTICENAITINLPKRTSVSVLLYNTNKGGKLVKNPYNRDQTLFSKTCSSFPVEKSLVNDVVKSFVISKPHSLGTGYFF